MPDILNTLTANLVRFADGERPAASKFNAVNNYFSRSLKDIATVIGDVRDMSQIKSPAWNIFDTSNTGRPLDIVNIGRLIGPASNLNPKMQGSGKIIEETIPAGTVEFKLKYKVGGFIVSIPGYLGTNINDGFENNLQFKLINNSILFSSPTTNEVIVSYFTDPSSYHGGINYLEAGFNVIPDPNQNTKLSVVLNNDNSYSVSLGMIQAQQSGIVDLTSSVLVDASEYNHNLTYRLPEWMIDKYSTADNKQIEVGEIYLKNITKSERYENATYTYVSPTQVDISGVTLCTDDNYCLLICGTNITTSIDDLRNKNFLHSHDGTFGESRINVKDLSGIFRNDPSYGPSSEFGDFPMYLHRSGYGIDTNLNNGNNAMLGPLMMASTRFDPFDAANFPAVTPYATGIESLGHASQGIFFSSFDCFLTRRDTGTLLLKNNNYKNIDIEARNLNLTSTAEIILNAPSALNLLSPGSDFSAIIINSAGSVSSQAGTFNRITAVTDIDIIAGEKLKIDAPLVNISNENELNQSYYSEALAAVSSGYKRLDDTASSWLNKADIESTVYKYKIEITPSTDPNQVIPSCKDSFLTASSFRNEAHFITDVLVANVSKYDATTSRYVPVAGHQNQQLVQAWENIDWKTKKYRMDYLDPSLFIHYKKEISKYLTDEENKSYGLWNGENSLQGIPPRREVFVNPASGKAKFSITGENRVRYNASAKDLSFRQGVDNSDPISVSDWNPSTLTSSINEYDITNILKSNINDFELISDTGVKFPVLRMNWFNTPIFSNQYSLSELISRYFLIKVERTGRGISWLRTKQTTETFPEAEVSISDSSNADWVHLNITATPEHLLWDQGEIYDDFVRALSNGEYTISVVRTFRDSGYSSLNVDTVRTIAGTFRVGWAKDSVGAGSKAMVDGTGAEAALLNIYRNSSNVGNIGYSSVGNNRHKLIIARDNLPTSTSEFKTRKFRVLIEGGEDKGAYVFLKEDWVLDGGGAGYYNWREVVNLALRYPGETGGKMIEIYINGKKMGGRANVIEGGNYEYKDVFDLPTGGDILNITELIKIAYGEITKGYFYQSGTSLMSFGANVAYPVGADLDGSYLGVDSVGDINGNTFSYHHFDLDLDCKETYNPFTGNVKLEINMSIITKRMGQATTGTSYDA